MCSSVTGGETGAAAPPPSLLSLPPPPLPLPPPPPVPPLASLGLPALAPPPPPCLPPDPRLVEIVLAELKSQGIFDQFRKECIADVDTKPAYQNLRQRVESSVAGFLASQTWTAELNKNHLREKLKKHILDSNFLDQGVERIVDQAVNPKISTVFIPQVEEIFYKYLGIEKPEKSTDANGTQNYPTTPVATDDGLLPNDLESVSPESVKSRGEIASEIAKYSTFAVFDEATPNEDNVRSDDSINSNDEDFESPAFEPLESIVREEGRSKDSHPSGTSDLASHDSNVRAVASIGHDSEPSSDAKLRSAETDAMRIYSKNAPDGDKKSGESVDETKSAPPKFDNDNSSDAGRSFEESGDRGKAEGGSENEIVETDAEIEKVALRHRDSVESKASVESPKIARNADASADSYESNGVFVQSVKNESENANDETHTFENKIEAVESNGENRDGLKNDDPSGDNTPEDAKGGPKRDRENDGKSGHSKSSKDRERRSSGGSSKDRRDSGHRSRSSHSKHSGGRRSDGRHSSSRDKKDDSKPRDSRRDSEHKSRDKHGKSSNGDSRRDSRKDRHGSSGHRSSSSHKSSRRSSDSKYDDSSKSRHSSTDKHDDKHKSRDSSSKSSSKVENKERHESKSHSDDKTRSSHATGGSRDRSSSKHGAHDKYGRTNSSDEKKQDKKSKKSSKEESCSASGKTRTRSTDRDSNDGSGGSAKGSNNGNANAKSPSGGSQGAGQKNKSSNSSGENSTNGNSSQSDSATSDSVSITSGKYIKSEFNMFEFGSMSAIKRHNKTLESTNTPKSPDNSVKSPDNFIISPTSPVSNSASPVSNVASPISNITSPVLRFDKSSPVKSPEIPNKKPVIHIDGQLKPEKFNEIVLTNNIAGETLRKPKCASNIYEAMRLRKVRREIEKLQQKRNQEAILLLEQQQNISKNASIAYSSASGPEVELTCMKTDDQIENNENNDKEAFKYFESDDDLEKSTNDLKNHISKLESCIDENERFEADTVMIGPGQLKNGLNGNKFLKLCIERVKMPADILSDEVQCREIITDIKSYNNNNNNRKSFKMANENLQKDILEIILGNDISIDAASISFNSEPTIEYLCGDNGKIKENSNVPLINNERSKSTRLARKRASTSTNETEVNLKNNKKLVNCNNNIDLTYSDKRRKIDKKMPLTENGMRTVY